MACIGCKRLAAVLQGSSPPGQLHQNDDDIVVDPMK